MSYARLKELAEYSRNAVIMLDVMWDIRGFILGLEEEQRRIPFPQRLERYEEALALIEDDISHLPQDHSYHNLCDLTAKIANGDHVTTAEAEIATVIFANYNHYFLKKYGQAERGM